MHARVDWVLIIFGTQVTRKKRPVRLVFPDNLSVSYDCTKTHILLIGLILTNKLLYFNKLKNFLMKPVLITTAKWLQHFSNYIFLGLDWKYRSYKKFDEETFLNGLKRTNIRIDEKDPNQNYQSLTKTFLNFVNKSSPLKKRIVRGSQTPLMAKEFQQKFYHNKHITAYKRQHNLCVSLRRKNIKSFLNNVVKRGIITNKNFRAFIKPFLTNKGF